MIKVCFSLKKKRHERLEIDIGKVFFTPLIVIFSVYIFTKIDYSSYFNIGFVVKPSNIRIWIHDKDVGKLTRVLWTGQGNRLRSETSTNPKVRKFLENVPHVMVN